MSFENVTPEDFKTIPSMPWFTHQAVLADAENTLEALERYSWDGKLFWAVSIDSLTCRVWLYIITVVVSDLSFYGVPENRRIRHVADVFKGLTSLPNELVIEED